MRFACLALSFFLITGCGASQDDLRIYAGPNIYSDGHEPIQLHAKLLGDSKLKAYSYKWSITKKPESSKATIENEDSLTGTLIPDQAGDYEVKLSLSKFGYTFEEDTAAITIADSYSSSKNGEVYASAELQEAIDKLGSHTEILLNPLSTYLIDSEINLRDFHNIRINGRGATLKRADSKFTTVTLSDDYNNGINLSIKEYAPNIKTGDTIAIAKSQAISDLETRTVVGVSHNRITVNAPFTSSYSSGQMAFKSFYLITGLPSHIKNGTNPSIIIENIVFDGNSRKNSHSFGWRVNGTIGLHGGKTSKIRHNKFFDIPNENIVGHGTEVHHNTFANLNGSAFHTSVHDTTKSLNAESSFHDNIVLNPNRVPQNLNGHSEGAITFSWGAGNLDVYNNTFESSTKHYGVFGIFAGERANTDENLIIRNNTARGFEYVIKIYSPEAFPVSNVLITKNIFEDSGEIIIRGGSGNRSIRTGCNYNGDGIALRSAPDNLACL